MGITVEPYDERFFRKHRIAGGNYTDVELVYFWHRWIQACAKVCPDSKCGRMASAEWECYADYLKTMTPHQRKILEELEEWQNIYTE